MYALDYSTSKNLYRHTLYLQIADIIAQNSVAIRAQVGAIIVKNGQIISDGYNGMPTNFDNCCEHIESDGNIMSNKEVLHAESNALMKLCRLGGFACNDATLYCNYSPCFDCAKLIIQSGIKSIFFSNIYHGINGLQLCIDANIKCTLIIDATNYSQLVDLSICIANNIELFKHVTIVLHNLSENAMHKFKSLFNNNCNVIWLFTTRNTFLLFKDMPHSSIIAIYDNSIFNAHFHDSYLSQLNLQKYDSNPCNL